MSIGCQRKDEVEDKRDADKGDNEGVGVVVTYLLDMHTCVATPLVRSEWAPGKCRAS